MNAQQILLVTNIWIISCCLALVLLIVLTKLRRTVQQTRTAAKIGPYRRALLAVAAGEDVDGIICVVHRGEPRAWTEAEANLVQQSGVYAAQVVVEAERQRDQADHVERLERLD